MMIIKALKNVCIDYDDQSGLMVVFEHSKKDNTFYAIAYFESFVQIVIGDYIGIQGAKEFDLMKINKCKVSIRDGKISINGASITLYK